MALKRVIDVLDAEFVRFIGDSLGFSDAFPAVHTVLVAVGSGVPRGQEGESHDVRWWTTGAVRGELQRQPEAFIPSSRAALLAYLALKESSRG